MDALERLARPCRILVMEYLGFPHAENFRRTRALTVRRDSNGDSSSSSSSSDADTEHDAKARLGVPTESSLCALHAVYSGRSWSAPLAGRLRNTALERCAHVYSVEIGHLVIAEEQQQCSKVAAAETNDRAPSLPAEAYDYRYRDDASTNFRQGRPAAALERGRPAAALERDGPRPWEAGYAQLQPGHEWCRVRQNSGAECANCCRPFSGMYSRRGGDSVWFTCGKHGCASTVTDYWYTVPYYGCIERLRPDGPCCSYNLCRSCYLDRPRLHADGTHQMALLTHTFCEGGRYCVPGKANFPTDRHRSAVLLPSAHAQATGSAGSAVTASEAALRVTRYDAESKAVAANADWHLFMRSHAPRQLHDERGNMEWYVDCADRSPTAWRVVLLESCGKHAQCYFLLGSIAAFARDFPENLRSLSVFPLSQ